MASNSFGTLFRITTFGESHGKALGVVIDGCPAGLPLSSEEINCELQRRRGGTSAYVTPRAEKDLAEIYSGVFEGKTTGAPIAILIFNKDIDSSKYHSIQNLLRPGHANYTYLEKYGIFDYRGGGRSSARETVCRVAAGAIAKKLLSSYGIAITAFLKQVGSVALEDIPDNLQEKTNQSTIFCPNPNTEQKIQHLLEQAKEEGDSLGGVIECHTHHLPIGLGDPIYEKLEANLAKAMLTIPATKGFEIGSGFKAVTMKGSEHNDSYILKHNKIRTKTNHAGGTLGGISNGMPLIFRVAFKPTSSIQKPLQTLTLDKQEATFELPPGSRHDPCVTIRAVPIVEAMTALTLADAILLNLSSQVPSLNKKTP